MQKVRSELQLNLTTRAKSTVHSRRSSVRSRNKADDKTTKVVGGHAMAVRDFSKAKKHGKYGKLNNISILAKDFGEQDNNGQDSMTW